MLGGLLRRTPDTMGRAQPCRVKELLSRRHFVLGRWIRRAGQFGPSRESGVLGRQRKVGIEDEADDGALGSCHRGSNDALAHVAHRTVLHRSGQ